MNHNEELLDFLIIGGDAGGLAAAMYLGRFRRKALVIDDGGSRLAMIPIAATAIHNSL